MTSGVTTDMKDGRIARSMRENLSGLRADSEPRIRRWENKGERVGARER